jgi:hypothetical protein
VATISLASQSGAAAWGEITGTLSAQTDLQSALDGKSGTGHNHAGVYEPANANIQTHDPVGSLYTSTLSTNPGTLLGRGTWSAFGAGRIMIGRDAADADFDTAEETGGSKTSSALIAHTHIQDAHTHVQNSHNHTQDAHTHTQNAHTHVQDAHNHTQNSFAPRIINSGTAGTVGVQGASAASNANASNSVTTATNQAATATNQNATAVNQNATATNQVATAVNQDATATNQSAGSGTSFSLMNPYIVVYSWKRTA